MPRPFLLAVSLVAIVGFSAHCAERKEDWHRELATPSPEFSQMPFWFWNDDLDDLEIARQMAEMRAQGVFGFVIHARMGLPNSIAYMGERWLAHVKFAVEEAARTGMRVCLYDEGMYPSGSAHGDVVRSNPAFAAQGLAVTTEDLVGPREIEFAEGLGASGGNRHRQGQCQTREDRSGGSHRARARRGQSARYRRVRGAS